MITYVLVKGDSEPPIYLSERGKDTNQFKRALKFEDFELCAFVKDMLVSTTGTHWKGRVVTLPREDK